MPNIKSAIKRVKKNDDNRGRNQSVKAEMRSAVKRVESLVAQNNAETAKSELQVAVKKIDKAVQKGLLHKNNGDRKKSNLSKKVNKLNA
ncbi:30S ribosomal protein S20 [Salirhabdus salicampi]|uniref:30S ribosomal protein S20 n=1 Tax=Salirhabdus salicampi TaxID=476102 RepID=UPI0020C2A4AB|nr:30S ribosomal protein S20 [Salirhabdus salicampi]MCP8616922.1 30S ribosomal protein S20 [Salirhabdus salicampi]